MAVGDHTGQIWLSGFNDVGTMLFGMTGDELHGIQVCSLNLGMSRNIEF
jgi:replication factor A1